MKIDIYQLESIHRHSHPEVYFEKHKRKLHRKTLVAKLLNFRDLTQTKM